MTVHRLTNVLRQKSVLHRSRRVFLNCARHRRTHVLRPIVQHLPMGAQTVTADVQRVRMESIVAILIRPVMLVGRITIPMDHILIQVENTRQAKDHIT